MSSTTPGVTLLLSLFDRRIHVFSGILTDSISADEAEETFLTNICLAADECAKVLTRAS